MAKTRVFVSSTYYDLKHVRASLENFIDTLGYEPVLSEKGDIAFTPDAALEESCYREVGNADIFVLIIGGRYGSEAGAHGSASHKHAFFDRYDSVTKKEYSAALSSKIPIYILIERSVYAEYRTYLRNRDLKEITYAHVDSANIFLLIEEILSQPRNNPVHEFDRYQDIETWLKEQWSGYFKELLKQSSNRQQLLTLSAKIAELAEVNNTLKRYLEEVVSSVVPDKRESQNLIQEESKRLETAKQEIDLSLNAFMDFAARRLPARPSELMEMIRNAESSEALKVALIDRFGSNGHHIGHLICHDLLALRNVNEAREYMRLPPFKASKAGTENHE